MSFKTSFYLEGLTHQVGKHLSRAMKALKAQAVTCFVGHEHSAGDLRLVYQNGLHYPETLYGVLSRRALRQFYVNARIDASYQFVRYAPEATDLISPLLFRRTPAREGYTSSLQRLWQTGGCPNAMVFFNFRRDVPNHFASTPEVQDIFDELATNVDPSFARFWDSPVPQDFTPLMRAAEAVGARVFFEMKEFETMTRAARNRAFADLLTATINADPILRSVDCWWNLYVPSNLEVGRLDTKLNLIAERGETAISRRSELCVGAFDSIESWVFWRDGTLRFTPQGLIRKKSRFNELLLRDNLYATKGVLSVPLTSGDEIFAVATLGISDFRGQTTSEITAAQNRLVRSIWFNGRRVCRAWSQANDRRHANGLRLVFDNFIRHVIC